MNLFDPTADRVLTIDQVASWQGPPLILFIGVSTGGSLVHTVFDDWTPLLGQSWTLRGLDLPPDTAPDTYRRLVSAMRRNPAVHGAVITAHKLRLYQACASDLTHQDRLVDLTHEVNTLATGSTVAGYARDALSLTQIMPVLLRHSSIGTLAGARVLCLGAGGAATALLLALHLRIDTDAGIAPRTDRPAHITFADIDPDALDALHAVADRAGIDPAGLSFVHVRGPADCDALTAELPAPGIVINATGLGKTGPGSPVTERAAFAGGTLAWDLNYRGPLTFLGQAVAHDARTVDGWDYFVAGWAGALTAIADVPFTNDLLVRFSQAAAPFRPQPSDRFAGSTPHRP